MTHVSSGRVAVPKRRAGPAPRRDLFEDVKAALPDPQSFCARYLPGGRVTGREYAVLNPTRADRRPGSFLINVQTGRWADFATGDKGGDLISLYAYIYGLSQIAAARALAQDLGVRA